MKAPCHTTKGSLQIILNLNNFMDVIRILRYFFVHILKLATNETTTLHRTICTGIALKHYNNNISTLESQPLTYMQIHRLRVLSTTDSRSR